MKKREAKHVKGIVDGLLRKWEQDTVKRGNAVRLAWRSAIEEKVKEGARPVSFKKGILIVEVENSSLLYKLTLEKRKILEEFNKSYTGRKKADDVRFRVGTME